MKKITLLCFLFFSAYGFSQLALEKFEDGWSPVPAVSGTATDWLTLDNNIGTNVTWIQQEHSDLLPSYENATGTHAAYLAIEDVPSGSAIDYLISPVFNVPANGQLYFQSRLINAGNQGGNYRVKLLPEGADASNIDNYINLTTWTEGQINPVQTNYYEKTVPIPLEYIGTNVRIAFVMQGDNMDGWLIDWVRVTAPCLNPAGFTANVTGLGTVDLNWTNPGGASKWEIEIIPKDATPTGHGVEYEGTLPFEATGTATGMPLVQNPFEPQTDYKFFVRAICNDTGISLWVGPLEFRTAGFGDSCDSPIQFSQLPYFTSNDTGNFLKKPYISGAGCAPSGIWAFGIYGVHYRYTADFTGDVRIEMRDQGQFAGMFIVDECGDFGVDCLDSRYSFDGAIPDQGMVIESFPVIEGEDYYIFISAFNSVTTGYTLLVQEVTCQMPAGLSSGNINSTSARLSWDNPGGATMWEVHVHEAYSGIPVTGGEYSASTNTGFDVAGLEAGTYYEYFVRASCGNGVFSPWAGPHRFYTSVCNNDEQCAYTFVMGDINADKWGETMTVSQNGVPITILKGPGVGNTTEELTIGVCPDIPLQITWNTGGYAYHYSQEVRLSIKNPSGQIIYTMPNPPYGGLPGTIIYQENVNCDLICVTPSELSATNATQSTVDIAWNGPSTGNWEYYIVNEGSPAPTDSTNGTNTTTNPTLNVALPASGANYEFYVRMVCADGIFSEWSAPESFGSPACDPDNTCAYTFILHSLESYPGDTSSGWGESYMTIFQEGIEVAKIGNEFTTGNSLSVEINLCDDTPFEIEWTNPGSEFFNSNKISLDVYNPMLQKIFNLPMNSAISIGSVIYTGTVDCDALLCLPPTGQYVENAQPLTADLGWDGLSVGNWEYYIVEAGSPAPTAGTTGIVTLANPVTNVALDPSITNFDYYVRMVCPDSPDGFSEWTGPFNFYRESACDLENSCLYTIEMWGIDPFWGGSIGPSMYQIYQGGVLLKTLYLYAEGQGPAIEAIPLCQGIPYEIIATPGALKPNISITNPFGIVEFTLQFDNYDYYYNYGEVVYAGVADCTPPVCPMPQHPEVTDILPTQVTLDWEEMGTATSWQVWVLPVDSAAPVAGTEGITVTEKPFIYGNDPGEVLTPATDYKFFVMAICGEDNNSDIDGAFVIHPNSSDVEYTFHTAVANDICEGAINIPVNTGEDCIQTVTGNTSYAYNSKLTIETTCPFPTVYPDVWYSFVASSDLHTIDFTTNGGNYLGVFKGNCSNMEQIYCDSSWPLAVLSGLTPSEVYYVRISNFNVTPSPFELCIKTATAGPSITVSEDQYTIPQLVDQFLLGSECGTVTNISAVTGSNFGSNNGIGYFNRNGSGFPLEEGIILTTGSINQALGPWPGSTATLDTKSWLGDSDLDEIFPGVDTEPSYNASIIEFDFVPSSCRIAFDFVFASDIYGLWECINGNGTAILLSGPSGTPQNVNLALIPNTNIPVSTATIRDDNESCDGENKSYVGEMGYIDPLNSSTGYSGYTVAMEASATVVPGQQYHLKIVIADQPAHFDCHNSAIFISGKECSEAISLGPDLTGDDAICGDSETIIDSGLDSSDYNFVWFKDGEEITGETSSTLTVTAISPFGDGLYKLNAYPQGSDCQREGSITIEFSDPINITNPSDLIICSATGFGMFDLSENNVIMTGENPNGYLISYHESQEDAENDQDPLDLSYTNIVQNEQIIYARIKDISGCVVYRTFSLLAQDIAPKFTIEGDLSICFDSTGTLDVIPVNFDGNDPEITYVWTRNGNPLPGTTANIIIDSPGTYEVTVSNGDCATSLSVTVTEIPEPVFSLGGPYIICPDEVVTIDVNDANFDILQANYQWTINGMLSQETTNSIIISEFGTYSLTVTVGNCMPVTQSIIVSINDINVAVEIEQFCENEVFQVKAVDQDGSFEPTSATYEWSGPDSFTSSNQQFTPPVSGEYIVTVTTAEGCTGVMSVIVKDTSCFIQRGISPNNDGLNDTFNLSSLDVKHLTIFNRYGLDVYQRTNYINEWGGQDSKGNELPTGTYFYMIQRKNGEELTGWIYINRGE